MTGQPPARSRSRNEEPSGLLRVHGPRGSSRVIDREPRRIEWGQVSFGGSTTTSRNPRGPWYVLLFLLTGSAAGQGIDWRDDYAEAAREAARDEKPLFVLIAWAKDGA